MAQEEKKITPRVYTRLKRVEDIQLADDYIILKPNDGNKTASGLINPGAGGRHGDIYEPIVNAGAKYKHLIGKVCITVFPATGDYFSIGGVTYMLMYGTAVAAWIEPDVLTDTFSV